MCLYLAQNWFAINGKLLLNGGKDLSLYQDTQIFAIAYAHYYSQGEYEMLHRKALQDAIDGKVSPEETMFGIPEQTQITKKEISALDEFSALLS